MRASGILMPVFSLPGAFGIGTLGKEAFAFVDFLTEAKQTYWQILPIGPTGKGGKALVRAVTVAGGANGQDLPIGLLCTGQKIHERKGFFPQRADAKGPRQTKNGHQNAACSHGELLLNP